MQAFSVIDTPATSTAGHPLLVASGSTGTYDRVIEKMDGTDPGFNDIDPVLVCVTIAGPHVVKCIL